MPPSWHEGLKYFIEDEFENKLVMDRAIKKGIPWEEINHRYNQDDFLPVDGQIIEACDQLEAFREATLSIEQGIGSKHLSELLKSVVREICTLRSVGLEAGNHFWGPGGA